MRVWLAALREAAVWFVDRWRFEANPESLAFDEAHGVDTASWTIDYEPILPSVCTQALDALPQAARTGQLVDLGCGKGRVLLLAADYGFERIVGVEHVAGLVGIARQNAKHWQATHPDASPIDILHADASELELPRGDLVLFLYNPFDIDVLKAVLDRVHTDHDGHRSVHAVYVNPLESEAFEAGWSRVATGGEAEWAWAIYSLAS